MPENCCGTSEQEDLVDLLYWKCNGRFYYYESVQSLIQAGFIVLFSLSHGLLKFTFQVGNFCLICSVECTESLLLSVRKHLTLCLTVGVNHLG